MVSCHLHAGKRIPQDMADEMVEFQCEREQCKTKKGKTTDVHEAQGAVLDWIILFFFLQPVTFTLCICALSLIEAQKERKRLNCRLNCTPRSFEH